ncbi:MAG: HAMP domain-containing histidine kinase [bacterium]|nr:HAMP domain-containing histidine kinase [bacterium]
MDSDFRHFKNKIFFRTILMVLIAGTCIYLMYTAFLSGRFADWMVRAYHNLFRLNYDAAYTLYQHTFRNHMDLIILAAVACMFFIVFRIYLNWFTAYFEEIGKGMDSLISEKEEDVSLPSELLPLEHRINTVKHTIEKQKSDILTTEKRKNDLIMYLAHDLKTPLASVIGYLNLLRDEKEISEEVREKYLSISLEKAERLEELINEFFEIARFNLSDIALQYSRISLTRLLEQILYEFGPMLKEKDLTGSLNAGEDFMLLCDADKIQRVFDNLLRNAVMYSNEGGEIVITAERVPDQIPAVAVTVLNQGSIIPEEKLERIFEQFYRLDDARGTRSGGAGLGLAIAKQIVELHGGSITAQSGEGRTRFCVTLPVKAVVGTGEKGYNS